MTADIIAVPHGTSYLLLDVEAVQSLGSGIAGDGVLCCGGCLEPGPPLTGALVGVGAIEQVQLLAFEIGSPLQGDQRRG